MSANHPPTLPTAFVCQRDSYIDAAISEAWAANAHTAVGNADAASADIDLMVKSLRQAQALCSDAPAISKEPCDTAWITCDYIAAHLP